MHSGIDAGQLQSSWEEFWAGQTPEHEMAMWDFYGGRPWVLRYTPRFGRSLEAGCGLGRYVFLLERLGVRIDGLDFHGPSVERVQSWGSAHQFNSRFLVGDVNHLPYRTGALSGYLSFGVIEHFREGCAQALSEACRVLQPGGVAIISTPARSLSYRLLHRWRSMKRAAKRISGLPVPAEVFMQHWWTLSQLKRYVADSGLWVSVSGNCDVKYGLWELGARPGGSNHLFRLADRLERTPLVALLGAQNYTISIKVAPVMHCFGCGAMDAADGSLSEWTVPICARCAQLPMIQAYRRRGEAPRFHAAWRYNPPPDSARASRVCHSCRRQFVEDAHFDGHHGFSVPICRSCLATADVNIPAANGYLLPVWRSRDVADR